LLLDQGGVYGAGSATHHLTMYRAPSGALVFGAGTVQWTWGLDNNHDNPFSFNAPAASSDMQQAVVNLFADMGVQPATLQPGLENWTYAWTPATSGNYTIRTRATDDSANLEVPSAGITVAATTTAQTLTSLTLNTANVTGGNPVQGTVTLGQPAASGGVVVTLS